MHDYPQRPPYAPLPPPRFPELPRPVLPTPTWPPRPRA